LAGLVFGYIAAFFTPLKVSLRDRQRRRHPAGCSAMLIDATRKWDYPPVSLPKKEYMERARQLWERLELPKLKPQDPWFGYNLGLWSDEDEAEAQLAVKGEHYQTGEKRLQQRVKVKKF